MKFNGKEVAVPFPYEFDARQVDRSICVEDRHDDWNPDRHWTAYVYMKNGDTFEFDSDKWGDRVAWKNVTDCYRNWNNSLNINTLGKESVFRTTP